MKTKPAIRSKLLIILALLALLVSGAVTQLYTLTGFLPHSAPGGTHGSASVTRFTAITATPVVIYQRPELQTGVIFPQWGTNAYSQGDVNWSTGLDEIEAQTGARWIEMPINLYQETAGSTVVEVGPSTPTPQSVRQGIEAVHAMGKHVFLVPLISLYQETTNTHDKWSGDIQCDTAETCTSWFNSYFAVLKPYLEIAQETGTEQVAIGTEFATLEILREHYWDTLIDNISSLYHGKLTYNLNFSTLIAHANYLPSFFSNPKLYALGVSAYFSLQDTPAPINPHQVAPLWAQKVRAPLDALSRATGKHVVISEIGYRNSTDALYLPYLAAPTPNSKPDPTLQAAAYDTAMKNVVGDTRIVGIYFWAWSVSSFAPNNLPAASVLHKWYTSPEA